MVWIFNVTKIQEVVVRWKQATFLRLWVNYIYIHIHTVYNLYEHVTTIPSLEQHVQPLILPNIPRFCFFWCKKSTRPGKRWPSNSTFTNDLVSLSSGVFGVKPYKTWQKSEFWRHLGVATDCQWPREGGLLAYICSKPSLAAVECFSRLSCQHFIRKWKLHANSHWFKFACDR